MNDGLKEGVDYIIEESPTSVSFANVKGFYDVITSINRFICQSRIDRDYYSWLDALDMLFTNTEPWWLNKDDIKAYEELYESSYKKVHLLENMHGSQRKLIENKLFINLRAMQRMINKNTKHLQVKENDRDIDDDMEWMK